VRLGIKTSAITLGVWDVPVVMLCYVSSITIWALALVPYVYAAIFYIAMMVALAQVVWHFTLIRARTRDGCFKAFRLNHWLGFTVFAGIAASYVVQ
jgi:4-hydroxybenzoate polyprenyltransferase